MKGSRRLAKPANSATQQFSQLPEILRTVTAVANDVKNDPLRNSNVAQGKYLCAAEPTIADLFCYCDVAFAEICAFDLNRWPKVAKWARRVMLLPGFKAPFELLAMEDAELS
jgi:glutathione S-transferase